MKEKEIIECKLLISKAGALLLARRRRSLRRTGVNAKGKYNNYPLVLSPKSYLLKQYHPNYPMK